MRSASKSRSWFVAGGLFTIVGLLGCSPSAASDVGDDDGSGDESALVGGRADSVDSAVVAVVSPNKPSWICSGTVIAPRVVLTAAHCVQGGNSDKTGWTFRIFFGADRNRPKADDRTIDVTSYRYADLYRKAVLEAPAPGDEDAGPSESDPTTEPTSVADGDIALLFLAQDSPVAPARWNRGPLPANLRGQPVRFVGYGLRDPKNPTSNGQRRSATLRVESVDDDVVRIPAAAQNPCHGDSGGPMFATIGGVETVIAVGHMMNGESCTDGANYIRTDRYADFVGGTSTN